MKWSSVIVLNLEPNQPAAQTSVEINNRVVSISLTSFPPLPRRGVFHALSHSSALPRAPDKQFPYLGCFPQQNEAAVFRHFPAEPIASSGAVMDQKRVRSLCQGARRITRCPSPPDPAGSGRTAHRWYSPAPRPAGGASPRWAWRRRFPILRLCFGLFLFVKPTAPGNIQ